MFLEIIREEEKGFEQGTGDGKENCKLDGKVLKEIDNRTLSTVKDLWKITNPKKNANSTKRNLDVQDGWNIPVTVVLLKISKKNIRGEEKELED